jgi:glycosyltransferase involved in cell wall biosynthesis
MTDRVRTWHIFDGGLTERAPGHHAAEVLALAKELARRGQAVSVYGNVKFRGDGFPVPVVPQIRHSFYEPLSKDQLAGELSDFIQINTLYLEDLSRIDRSRFSADDIALFPTVSENQLLAIGRWAQSFTDTAPFKTVMVAHRQLDVGFGRRQVSFPAMYYRYAWTSVAPDLPRRLFLCATTAALAAEYANVLGTWPSVLPFLFELPPLSSPARPSGSGAEFVVAHLGEVHRHKGFPLLPSVVKSTADIPALRYFVQAWRGSDPVILNAIAELRRESSRVTLVTDYLEIERYHEAVDRADLILLLHDPDSYRSRMSGVYAQATLAGKPVVACSGTWMGEQVRAHGNGILFSEHSAQSVRRAILEAIEKIEILRERAHAHAVEIRGRSGVGAVIDHIEALGPAR